MLLVPIGGFVENTVLAELPAAFALASPTSFTGGSISTQSAGSSVRANWRLSYHSAVTAAQTLLKDFQVALDLQRIQKRAERNRVFRKNLVAGFGGQKRPARRLQGLGETTAARKKEQPVRCRHTSGHRSEIVRHQSRPRHVKDRRAALIPAVAEDDETIRSGCALQLARQAEKRRLVIGQHLEGKTGLRLGRRRDARQKQHLLRPQRRPAEQLEQLRRLVAVSFLRLHVPGQPDHDHHRPAANEGSRLRRGKRKKPDQSGRE